MISIPQTSHHGISAFPKIPKTRVSLCFTVPPLWCFPLRGSQEPGGAGRHVPLRGPLDGLRAAEHVAALRGGARHRHHHRGSLPDGRMVGGGTGGTGWGIGGCGVPS